MYFARKFKKKNARLLFAVLLTFMNLVMLHPSPTIADGGFGGIGENISSNTEGMSQGAKNLGFFAGFVCVIIGVIGFATMKKTQVTPFVPAAFILVGVVLLSVFAFITAGSETLFGSDSATGVQELNLAD